MIGDIVKQLADCISGSDKMKTREHLQAVLEAANQDLKDEVVNRLLDEGYESLEEDGPADHANGNDGVNVPRDRSGLLEPVDFVNRGLPGRESGQHQIQVSPIKSKETD